MRLILLLILALSLLAQPAKKTKMDLAEMRLLLEGQHRLTLNWIELDDRTVGMATVEQVGPNLKLYGEHRSKKSRDSLVIDGVISSSSPKGFYFRGRLATQVSYNFVGKVCERKGLLFFEAAKDGRSWVLKETPSCGTHVDKVTFYMARP